jgi:hypothetical protein
MSVPDLQAALQCGPLGTCFGPWSALGCRDDAGSMRFRCAHLTGVLDVCPRRSGAQHRRNHVPAGPRGPAIRQATGCGSDRRPQSPVGMSCRRPTCDAGLLRSGAPARPWPSSHVRVINLGAPASQPCLSAPNRRENGPAGCFLTLLIHHDGCSLAQRAPQIHIACIGYAA